MSNSQTNYRIDDIDRRIIHALMADARNTSAPMIAEQVNVSPGTIRNRIKQLEEHGIVSGYHANVDFERAEDKLTYLYVCTAPPQELETLARDVRNIRGVVNVRELMTGSGNLHVLAVGETTADFKRIMRSLSELEIELVDKNLVQNELFEPYAQYGGDDEAPAWEPTDFLRLAGGTDIVEVTVGEAAPIVDLSLAEAADRGVLDEDALVVAIERDGRVLTPRGETVVLQDDVVTLVSRGGEPEEVIDAFHTSTSKTV
ncbi:AsnC family transcriptional regulator [Halorubrum sp. JWXQ-INN 858]|uniref:Lrp/AsnC family transcriptional regulator n=1 Tax=Halorubrum sp. JWXQ-INN 858 TaxID=2690782 RepID=UPI002AA2B076|nr:AsnC family transcriptional regulator [Halorubrum sp. JWXQ-INN 858]